MMHTAPTATNNIVIMPLYLGPNSRSNNIRRTAHNSENIIPPNIRISISIANALSNSFPSYFFPLHAGQRDRFSMIV